MLISSFRIDCFIDNPSEYIHVLGDKREENVLEHIKKEYKDQIKQKICDMIMNDEIEIRLSCGDSNLYETDNTEGLNLIKIKKRI